MLLMLLTTASAWAFKTETPVTYTVSYISYNHQITIGGGTNTSWTASSIGVDYYWAANVSHALANGMSVKTSADVKCNVGFMTTASTTFTFTTSGNTAISGVTFMGGSVTATSSEPGTTFTVTLAQGSTFTGFVVTYGNISGSCGTSATWSLAKQSGQYTALTIGGSGALTISGSDAPWGTDLTSVTIGSNITSIGNYAFNGCTALTRVNVQKTNGLVTLSSSAFNGCSALQHIVVPTPAIAVGYQTAANWSTHAAKLRVAFGSYLFAATDEGGTAAYAITSETDLRNLSAVVNAGGGEAVRDLTFRQTANITLNGTFTPMGYDTDNSWTMGTYDGGGYTISGLNVNYYIDQYAWHGLFGYVNAGTVKNVVLINPSFPNKKHSGALIGKLVASEGKGSAMNCYAYGTGTLIYEQQNNPTVTNVGRARKVTLGSGVTVSPAATDIANGFVYNNESYYREGLELTLSSSATVPTGYTQTYSANGSAISGTNYTVNSTDGDVTVSLGALIALSGSCGDNATWTMTDEDGNGSYETLTISGTGAVTSSPWATGFAATIQRVNILSADLTISGNPFSTLGSDAIIVVPTPAYAVGYSSAAYAEKLRVALGNYLFTVTDEGGTVAYAIASETDLRNLSAYVNAGSAVNNMTFRQTQNIAMSSTTFAPIGKTGASFQGTYDGGGYVISGLNAYEQYYAGLFGRIGGGATIKNVNLMNPTITGGSTHRGAVVGMVNQGAGCNISNCHYYGSNDYAVVNKGGGNGSGYNTVTNCGRARKVTAGDGVIIAAPAATEGFTYGDDNYYREGLTLTLGATATTGYTAVFSANGTVIDGETYTVNSTDGDVTVSVEWTENVLTLLNNDSAQPEGSKNADIIAAAEASGKTYNRVTLQGRTLYKDGEWNTLCLPFSLTEEQIAASPLAGATIKTMDNTAGGTRLDRGNGTLTLKFNTVDAIEAGKPYIIKWDGDGTNNIVNPVFQGVTISSTTPTAVESWDWNVTFVGQYSPFSIVNSGATGDNEGNKNEILLMTKGNKIGYSKNPRTLNCFRCHFYVPTSSGEFTARNIEVDFGEGEATSVASMEDGRSKMEDVYYTLDGRKLEGKPTAKGMYIVNGRKVIIK